MRISDWSSYVCSSDLNGPDYVNATAAGPLMRRIVETFDAGSDGPRFALFFGHDTNLADLRALLDIDWKVRSYPTGDVPPGGALGVELLRDGAGKEYGRAFFRAQTRAVEGGVGEEG